MRFLTALLLLLAGPALAGNPVEDTYGLKGSGSGVITMKPQAAAGTWNWNFPITAGTSGQVLASAGGVAAPMTWTTLATVATSGSATDLSSGALPAARMPALTGDITTSAGAVATTLATVNSNVGTWGDGTHVGAVTVNAKGLVTAASSVAITGAPPSGSAGGGLAGTYPNPTVSAVPASALPALTGDVTSSAGSAATTLAAGSASNLNSGTLAAARMPAHTGDVTSSAGSVALTLAAGSASNLNSGTLAAARGGAGTITGALKGSGAGVVTQAACADLSNGATGCSTATGTSGATIPLLNGTNVWSAQQSVTPSTLAISTATFTPDGTSNNYTLTLVHASCPCTLANPSATPVAGTGGQIVVKQSATGSDTIGTWGSQYEASGGTSTLTLSTAANAVDVLSYYVRDSTHIELSLLTNFSH